MNYFLVIDKTELNSKPNKNIIEIKNNHIISINTAAKLP